MTKLQKQQKWDKLLEWRRKEKERYAEVLLGEPPKTTINHIIPRIGTTIIMGERRGGKSGLAHTIAEHHLNRYNMSPVLHLPMATKEERKKIRRLLPEYFLITADRKEWPVRSVIIYDESSQSAHARRSSSKDAVDLDNLIGISGQREQLICFISHHSRKLDLNVITEANLVIWKAPSYAHYLWEREELQDFALKAFQFFDNLKTDRQRLTTSLAMNFRNFTLSQFTNGLPGYWSQELSCLFEQIKGTKVIKEGAQIIE